MESSSHLKKEAILDVPYNYSKKKIRKFLKGYEYTFNTFGVYNIERSGTIAEIKREIEGLLDPKSLSRKFPKWQWELKKGNKRGLLFEGVSSTGDSMTLKFPPLTSKDLTENIEALQVFFSLLKVPLPSAYRAKYQKLLKE